MATFSGTQEIHYSKQMLLQDHAALFQTIHSSQSPSPPNINENPLHLNRLAFAELNKFQAIGIVDLFPGVDNTGKIIYSTIISDVVIAESFLFIIEDEFENACRVSAPAIVSKSQFKRGFSLVVLNPYYQMAFDGKYSLIIRDPSNLSLLNFGPPKPLFNVESISEHTGTYIRDAHKNTSDSPLEKQFPLISFDSEIKLPIPTPCEVFADLGIKMFDEDRFIQAIVHFTCAIQTNPNNAKLYEFRAFSYTNIGYFEEALIDAEKAKSLLPDCVKYQICVARWQSRVGNHVLSLELLKKIKPKDNAECLEIKILTWIMEVRVKQVKGIFDFEVLKECFNEDEMTGIGDYVGPIIIGESDKHERGLFVTRDVKKGENLAVTEAFNCHIGALVPCFCRKCRLFNLKRNKIKPPEVLNELILNLRKSKHRTICFFSTFDTDLEDVDIDLYSYSGYDLSRKIDTSVYPLDDLHNLIRGISLFHDHYRLDTSVKPADFHHIWLLPSLINHSCIPNAMRLYIGDICIVRALSDIPNGSEIFVSYLPLALAPNVQVRADLLDFKCDCKLCGFEKGFEHKEEISQLIDLQFELSSKSPVPCSMSDEEYLGKIKKFNREKWLYLKGKAFRLVKLLPLSTLKLLSVSFQSIIISLFLENPNQTEAINLAIEAEPYFSDLDPETYVRFWTLCNQAARGHLDPEDERFQLIQNKFYEVKKLFF